MKDDLFERLQALDPVTDERITRESGALGGLAGRIAADEPSTLRRLPPALRRRVAVAAIAAVVVVAIVLPLALLRPLGGGETPGDDPGNWVAVGTLAHISSLGVVYEPEIGAFLVATAGDPVALSAAAGDVAKGERAIYCEPSDRFVDPAGDVFDGAGAHLAGPRARGLDHFAVRVISGVVQVEASAISPAGAGDSAAGRADPQDLECQTANGIFLEGEPGFAIPDGTELPPIAVALPQSGTLVQSPVLITGSANVFEATVTIRVLNAHGEVIAEAFTTATCGTGCRGDFSAEVELPIDIEQPGTIVVFESSAQDGSILFPVEIPVTLVPST